MLSIGLWRRYINITITILDIIHRPVFYLKLDVPETEFCLRLEMEPTPLRRQTSSVNGVHLSRFHQSSETESSLRNFRVDDDSNNNNNSVAWVHERIYRSRDRCLSAKLVPTFVDRGCHVVSAADPYGRNHGFLDRSRYFFFQAVPQFTHEAEWTPFQTHYFSENVVASGI
jgi:hypothetical protein